MSSWHSYGSIYNLGHRAVQDLLSVPHIIEEKVDGSQFSFGLFENDGDDGIPEMSLAIRSKGCVMIVDAPEKMFNKAAETVKGLADRLHPGWTYRGEYLAKPKHNTLAYDRVPEQHIVLFDIATEEETYLPYAELKAEADRLGLETVPLLAVDSIGGVTTLEQLRNIIDTQKSILGGALIEGIVVKPTVPVFGPDKKLLMGKFVSERSLQDTS